MVNSYKRYKLAMRPVKDNSEAGARNEAARLRRTNEALVRQVSELQVRNAELEAYAHTVAHDLKNPLSVLIVTAAAISEIRNLTPSELKEFMQQIQSTAYDMDRIIENLLLFSEVSSREVPLEVVDMTRAVSNTLKRLRTAIEEYHGRILLPESWPASVGYAPWVEEVWANYITNALKYGGNPPRLELGASIQPNGMIRYWVRDNGRGIPAEARRLLFAPFARIGDARRSGHGLGLSIVRRIVDKLGGQTGVESEVGKGSLFFFTLPAAQAVQGVERPERNLEESRPLPALSLQGFKAG